MRISISLAIVLLCALVSCPRAARGDEFLATSPDGARRIEVRSPGESWGPSASIFRAKFEYTLIETESGSAIWSRKQEPQAPDQPESAAEGYPTGVAVDDAGRVAVVTDTRRFLILEPTSGRKVFDAPLPDPGGKETEQLVEVIASGRLWEYMTTSYLLDAGRVRSGCGPCFVVRFPWGRRVFLDLEARKFLGSTEVDDTLVRAAAESERQWALGVLARCQTTGIPEPDVHRAWIEFQSAVWLAGVLKIAEAVDSLRQFEKDEWFGWTNVGQVWRYRILPLRRLVHLSLRRLGHSPKSSAAVLLFWPIERDARTDDGEPLKSSVRMDERAGRAETVKIGMTPKELVETIGTPDDYWNGGFAYDMDAATPFTLHVELGGPDGSVSKVESIPAGWKDVGHRDWGAR